MNYIAEKHKEIIKENNDRHRSKMVMVEFYDILSNTFEPQKLNEVTIDRVLNKHGNNGMVIISANRSDLDGQTNNKNTKELIKDIRQSGFSYFPVYGGYHDKNSEVVDNYEPSFVVVNYDKNGNVGNIDDLKKFAIDMCGKYNQDSVLIKEPNKNHHYYDRNGKCLTNSSNKVWKNDINQEFFTSLIKTNDLDKNNPDRSKRFTYDIQFKECYCNPNPCTINEKMRRKQSGEILLV